MSYFASDSQSYNENMREIRKNKLGFCPQTENLCNHYLPYAQQLDEECVLYLSRIKANISRGLVLNDWNALNGFPWIEDLSNYISLYGLCFSKEDHIYFTKLLYNVIIIPELYFQEIMTYATILIKLLKKKELISSTELTIPWRPLYELYNRTNYSKYKDLGIIITPNDYKSVIEDMIKNCRTYFSIESTQEMLDEWRPLLCPFDTIIWRAMDYIELFLPTLSLPENHKQGFKLWFEEFMLIWKSCQQKPQWERRLISLFSRLASDTIGLIDWDPYIPYIFTRLRNGFEGKHYSYFDAALWLISMLGPNSMCQKYLTQLFKAIQTYYYPSNCGDSTDRFLSFMSQFSVEFTDRLHRERHKKHSWLSTIPDNYKLTEENITDFVNSLINIVMISMFNPSGCSDSVLALRDLSQLRPDIVIPKVFDEFSKSLDLLAEPHRLVASIRCLTAILPSLINESKSHPEYFTHLCPLLANLLDGLDVNDIDKLKSIFKFIEIFAALVPPIDCSSYDQIKVDLTQNEIELCLSTAGFGDYVIILLDRCFELINKTSSLSSYRLDQDKTSSMTDEEWAVLDGINSALSKVLYGTSPQIFKICLNNIFNFVVSHLFETDSSTSLTVSLMKICLKINPKLTLLKFMPYFGDKILDLCENKEISNDESVDQQLLYSLKVFHGLVTSDGSFLMNYSELIIKIIDETINFKCVDVYQISSNILKETLKSLTILHELDLYDQSKQSNDPQNQIYIKDWGKTYDIKEVDLKWHKPSDEEMSFAKSLLERYLINRLHELNSWTEKTISLTNEELRRILYIVDDCVIGAQIALPDLNAKQLNLSDSIVSRSESLAKCFGYKTLEFENYENIRETVVLTAHSVLRHMMSVCEDNIKSFGLVIGLLRNSLLNYGMDKNSCTRNKNIYKNCKNIFQNKLLKNKRHIRSVQIQKFIYHFMLRASFERNYKFTELHKIIVNDLMQFSTSHYSGIRGWARNELIDCFKSFPYSHRLIIPDILRLLTKENNTNDEQLEGALFLLMNPGTEGFSILTNSDWVSMSEVLPALVNSKHSEIPMIIKLMDWVPYQISHKFYTSTISLTIPDTCVDYAKKVWTQNQSLPKPALECPSNEEVLRALEKANARNEININAYNQLIEKLVVLIEEEKLHWRYYELAFHELKVLIRHDISYPINAIKLFTKNLVNEKLSIRKLVIDSLNAILKLMKRLHKKHEIKSLPTDNLWLQTDLTFDYESEDIYKSSDFVDKPHRGFYGYENPFPVYKGIDSEHQKHENEFSGRELSVYTIFSSEEFIEKFLNFLTLEENRGEETFSRSRFILWKRLFKLFGPINIELIVRKITEYVNGVHDCQHRCGAEIMGGLIRGSKHWCFHELIKIRKLLKPLIERMFSSVSTETLQIWNSFIRVVSADWDPKRIFWIFRLYFDDLLEQRSDSMSSFSLFSKLVFLQSVFGELEWKCLKISQELLNYFETKHLNPIYQDIRKMIGSFLQLIFKFDDKIPCLPNTFLFAPKRSSFVDRVLPRLQILFKLQTDTIHAINERKDAINLLKTICVWIGSTATNSGYSAPPELFKFLPNLLLMTNEINDEELAQLTRSASVLLMGSTLTHESMEMAINTIKDLSLSTSWHSRQEISDLILTLVSSNLFTLKSNQFWINDLRQVVLNLLRDEIIEVRVTTENTLNSLMHCELIQISDSLINKFKISANHSYKKAVQINGFKSIDAKNMAIRHSGVLGLCACIKAYPYELPLFIPDILLFLTEHLNDPQPIPSTIRKTLSDFRRTHSDNWREHKLKFTGYQLSIVNDLLVSPTYYA